MDRPQLLFVLTFRQNNSDVLEFTKLDIDYEISITRKRALSIIKIQIRTMLKKLAFFASSVHKRTKGLTYASLNAKYFMMDITDRMTRSTHHVYCKPCNTSTCHFLCNGIACCNSPPCEKGIISSVFMHSKWYLFLCSSVKL